MTLVEQALRALDRATAAAELVDAEGMTSTTETTGTFHVHPAVRIERESRQLFARIWGGMLHLEWTSEIDGRTNWVDDWDDD
jgi:hypothetical protein